MPESHADVGGVELERVADRDEREGTVRENRHLETLLGLNPGASEGTSIELGR
jgi:hypothetical protein